MYAAAFGAVIGLQGCGNNDDAAPAPAKKNTQGQYEDVEHRLVDGANEALEVIEKQAGKAFGKDAVKEYKDALISHGSLDKDQVKDVTDKLTVFATEQAEHLDLKKNFETIMKDFNSGQFAHIFDEVSHKIQGFDVNDLVGKTPKDSIDTLNEFITAIQKPKKGEAVKEIPYKKVYAAIHRIAQAQRKQDDGDDLTAAQIAEIRAQLELIKKAQSFKFQNLVPCWKNSKAAYGSHATAEKFQKSLKTVNDKLIAAAQKKAKGKMTPEEIDAVKVPFIDYVPADNSDVSSTTKEELFKLAQAVKADASFFDFAKNKNSKDSTLMYVAVMLNKLVPAQKAKAAVKGGAKAN
jgi:hypothetical protein